MLSAGISDLLQKGKGKRERTIMSPSQKQTEVLNLECKISVIPVHAKAGYRNLKKKDIISLVVKIELQY
jgi:hypothetical protein